MRWRYGGVHTGWDDNRMIWLAGWIVGEAFVSLFLLVWGRENFQPTFWGPVRPPNPVGEIGVANFPRICIQGPFGSTTI